MTTSTTQTSQIMETLGAQAKVAAQQLAQASTGQKNNALLKIREYLLSNKADILAANAIDMEAGEQNNLSPALLDRLALDESRIEAMAEGLSQIAKLPDPVGSINDMNTMPSGIQVGKMRVPIGVIGIIYESRPNVTIDAAALCLKSANACILRGGKEAMHSNKAIAKAISHGLQQAGLSPYCVQVIETTDRAMVTEMIQAEQFVDVIIPRGGKNLIAAISRDAKVPVIKHLDGICHVYIDDQADHDKAIAIAVNAKCRRFGICGSMETLLIHEAIASELLPELAKQYQQAGVELRGCDKTQVIISAVAATEEDWQTEYLGPILSIRVVTDIEQAMAHIAKYGSHHTDSIVTENYSRIQAFLRAVDSSSVMVNASTQFADGFEYGLGAEIGISTNKLHVRGPVGLEGLTTEKYIVLGDGTIRA
jgi:glutamate-5-semialdehyde dehydrogenase